MWSEFKEFLLKANVLSLALAFIVGVALAAVVNSLVTDIIMPSVGMLLGEVDDEAACGRAHEDLPTVPGGGASSGDALHVVHQ